MKLADSSAFQNSISSLLLIIYFSAAVNSPAIFGSRLTRSRVCVRLFKSKSSFEQQSADSFPDKTAAHDTVGSLSTDISTFSVFTSLSVVSSSVSISTMLMSGSDLMTMSGSALLMTSIIVVEDMVFSGVNTAVLNMGSGKLKIVLGKEVFPKGVSIIVFVPLKFP